MQNFFSFVFLVHATHMIELHLKCGVDCKFEVTNVDGSVVKM